MVSTVASAATLLHRTCAAVGDSRWLLGRCRQFWLQGCDTTGFLMRLPNCELCVCLVLVYMDNNVCKRAAIVLYTSTNRLTTTFAVVALAFQPALLREVLTHSKDTSPRESGNSEYSRPLSANRPSKIPFVSVFQTPECRARSVDRGAGTKEAMHRAATPL